MRNGTDAKTTTAAPPKPWRRATAAQRCPKRPHARGRVLLKIWPDGFIEIFADEGIRAHVVNILGTNPECEAAADEYSHLSIPRRFRDLDQAGRLLTSANVIQRSAEQEADRLHYRHLVRGLVAVAKTRQPVPAAIAKRRAAG